MSPYTLVVSGPCGGIFLRAAVAGSCNDKRAFAAGFFQTIISSFRHKVTIDIVNLFVKPWHMISRKYNILRQGTTEACRLVHVVPDTADALVHQKFCLAAPPVSHGRGSIIRKDRVSGPDDIFVYIALWGLCEIVIADALVIHMISLFYFGTGIDDGD